MAFAVARHAAAVPVLLVNGTYRSTVRMYLDSSILQYQLQRLNHHDSMKGRYYVPCKNNAANLFIIQFQILLTDHEQLAKVEVIGWTWNFFFQLIRYLTYLIFYSGK